MCFGRTQSNLCKLHLNDGEIEWTDKWTYLGGDLLSGPRFNNCIAEKIRRFYRASNHIFRMEGKSEDTLMLRLIKTRTES